MSPNAATSPRSRWRSSTSPPRSSRTGGVAHNRHLKDLHGVEVTPTRPIYTSPRDAIPTAPPTGFQQSPARHPAPLRQPQPSHHHRRSRRTVFADLRHPRSCVPPITPSRGFTSFTRLGIRGRQSPFSKGDSAGRADGVAHLVPGGEGSLVWFQPGRPSTALSPDRNDRQSLSSFAPKSESGRLTLGRREFACLRRCLPYRGGRAAAPARGVRLMTGPEPAADGRGTGDTSRRPGPPRGRWSRLRRPPCRPRRQASPRGDSPFRLALS